LALKINRCDRCGEKDQGMDQRNRKELLDDIKQRDAIFALEGFEKTDTIRGIDEAVLAGVGTYEEAAAEMLVHVHQHKTIEGFAYSKAVDLPLAGDH
jgi:hypothetical protein